MLVGFHPFINYWRDVIYECCKDRCFHYKESNLALFKTLQKLITQTDVSDEFIASNKFKDFEKSNFVSGVLTNNFAYNCKLTSFESKKRYNNYYGNNDCYPSHYTPPVQQINKKNVVEYCKKANVEIVAINTPYRIQNDKCIYTMAKNNKRYYIKNGDFVTVVDNELVFYQLTQCVFNEVSKKTHQNINLEKFIAQTNELYKRLEQKTL